MKRKYLILWCKNVPNTEIICDCESDVRIKATKVKEIGVMPLFEGIYGIAGGIYFLFEDISNWRADKEQLLNAIDWFKSYIKLPSLRIVEIR